MDRLKMESDKKELVDFLEKLKSSDSKRVMLSMAVNLESEPGLSDSLVEQFIQKDQQGDELIGNLQELCGDDKAEEVLELVKLILGSYEQDLLNHLIINQNPMRIKFDID